MKLNAKGGSDSENVPTQRHHTIKNVRSRFAALHRDQGNSSRKGHVWLRRKGSHLEQDTHRVEINNGSLYPSERDVLRTHFAVEVDGDVDEGSLPWIACCSTGLLMLPGCLCDGRTYEVCGLPPVLGEKKGVSPHRSTPLRTLVTCGDSSGMWTFASAEEPCPTADHVPNAMLLHDTELPRHLERPARLRRIVEALYTSGLLATNEESKACLLPACDQMLDELILTVHAPEILANLTHRNAAAATYVNDSSLLAVRMALRVVLGAVRAVYGYGIMSETRSRTPACELTPTEHLPQYYDNAFCVVRPPGHHCTQCVADGFCLVNNVAIAAEYALRCIRERACMLNNLEEVGRVAIIDMDVHHGNGTQQIFQDRSDVLYMSLHRFDNGAFYPFTGAPQDVGSGRGKGYSINVGLNTRPPGLCISDFELLRCTRNIWMPILEQFSPHVLFISAGYDVIEGDPIGRQAVTTEAFGQAIQMLASQMSGKCVVVLEGGYNLRNLQEGSCATVHALHRAKKREAVDSKEVEEIDSSQEDGSKSESRRQRWSETMAQLAEAHKECPFGDILSRTRNE